MNQYKEQAIRLAGVVSVATAVAFGGGVLSVAKADEAAEIESVRTGISKLLRADAQPDSIDPSPLKGFYEVLVGTNVYYVSADGKYMINGKVFDIDKMEYLVPKKEAEALAQQALMNVKKLSEVDEKDMVIFAPEDYKYTVTVFTDIDCGYCRKLHKEMDKYNELGIRMRYLMFPRGGIKSPSYDKAVSVWCADDRNEAMTQAKSGKKVEAKTCENPVKDQYQLGIDLGVTGTPAMFFEDGTLVPGYVPAESLLQRLKANQG